ncbi:hypothetical protein [Pseudomonas sp. PD9R]|uniref:hypothetical protein n=1 Tax=Pseudomonas sp. PD9R TaxID=2853534 RepID=UPI002735E1B9|nr:hypothetical protein [Pseudomonas sp. PD9R]
MQTAHLPVRHANDVFQWRAVILQAWVFNYIRRAAAGGIELILIQAPAPGSCDGQVSSRAVAGNSALHGL